MDGEEVKKMPAVTAALLEASKDARKNLEEKLVKQEKENVELKKKVEGLQQDECVFSTCFSFFAVLHNEEN